jgi:hypothetical protein
MQNLVGDLRYGLRMLVKSRQLTLVALTALALGIGANTAIFTVVNAALLRPLPFRDAPPHVDFGKPPAGRSDCAAVVAARVLRSARSSAGLRRHERMGARAIQSLGP